MPVRVELPTRIRIDAAALDEAGRAELVSAIGAAAGRALLVSREEVLAPRGGYVGVRLHHPEFHWSGDGSGAVTTTEREEIEALTATALLDAAELSGVLDFALAGEEADPPLTDDGGETVDDDRLSALLGLYMLPSYQHSGQKQPVKTLVFDESEAIDVVGGYQWAWDIIRDEDYGRAFEDACEAIGFELPASGYFGGIYRTTRGLSVRVGRNPNDELMFVGAISGLVTWELEGRGKNERFVRKPVRPPASARFRLRWYGPGVSEADRIATAQRAWRDAIEGAMRNARDRLKSVGDKTIESDATFEEQLTSRVDAEVARQLKLAIPARGVVCFAVLEIDGAPHLIGIDRELPVDFDIELVPIRKLVEKSRKKQGARTGAGGRGKGGGTRETGKAGAKTGVGEDGVGEDGSGDGEAEEGGEQGGGDGFILLGEDEQPVDGRRYPSLAGAEAGMLCEPFWGEPPLSAIGRNADRVRALIAEIADKLDIAPCGYAGRFCLIAAEALAARVTAVTEGAIGSHQLTTVPANGRGNLGAVDFKPIPSPALQLLRHLASIAPLIDRLYTRTTDLMREPDHARLIEDGYPGWLLHLTADLRAALDPAVGWLFSQTCRVLMLQLLRSSRQGITDRLTNLENYAPLFEQMMLSQLADINELRDLRKRLVDALPTSDWRATYARPIADAWRTAHYATWEDAQQGMIDLLSGDAGPSNGGVAGELVKRGEEIVGIRDATGRVWTRNALDAAIDGQIGEAQAIDPLVKQIATTPGMIERFRRNRFTIRDELDRMLREMLERNNETTETVSGSAMAAFRYAPIGDDAPSIVTSVSDYPLTGILRVAYEEIHASFDGTPCFASGMRWLFTSEIGRSNFFKIAEIGGTLFLSIVCTPWVGMAVGAALSLLHEANALEREAALGAVFDPDLIADRAGVEEELFGARIGTLFAIIPVGGSLARGTVRATRAVARGGVRTSAQALRTSMRSRGISIVIADLKHGLVEAIVREVVMMELMDKLIEKALTEPLMDQLRREFPSYDPSAAELRDVEGR